MRRILFVMAFMAAVAVAMAQPRIEWRETEHDFGLIKEVDGRATARFEFVNTGDKPLVITGVRANCGCTTPKYSRQAIQPGEESAIEVSYDPKGRPGIFNKNVVVDINGEPPHSVLKLRGTVLADEATLAEQFPYEVGPIRVADRFVIYGDVSDRESKGTYIEAYNASSDTLRPTARSSSSLFSGSVSPTVALPGQKFIYVVLLGADKHGLYGPQSGTITLYADRRGSESLDVEVTCNVQESFKHLTSQQLEKAPRIVASPDVIDLGIITPGDGKEIKRAVKISNRGESPLLIRRIYIPDGEPAKAEMKAQSIKKDKSAELTVTIDPAALDGLMMVNTEIQVITNDPDRPVKTIRVVGEVRQQ